MDVSSDECDPRYWSVTVLRALLLKESSPGRYDALKRWKYLQFRAKIIIRI